MQKSEFKPLYEEMKNLFGSAPKGSMTSYFDTIAHLTAEECKAACGHVKATFKPSFGCLFPLPAHILQAHNEILASTPRDTTGENKFDDEQAVSEEIWEEIKTLNPEQRRLLSEHAKGRLRVPIECGWERTMPKAFGMMLRGAILMQFCDEKGIDFDARVKELRAQRGRQ